MGCGLSAAKNQNYALNTISNTLQPDDSHQNEIHIKIGGHKMENSANGELKLPTEQKIRMSTSQLVLANFQDIETDYSFVGVLGKGAYGCVKKGKHKILNVFRAIKCIEKKKMNNEENKKLTNEVEILKNLVNLLSNRTTLTL